MRGSENLSMKGSNSNFNVTDGTDQRQRSPAAFQPGYFNVDEMSFETLLSMASEYASAFNYFNAENQKEGSWADLFHANEVVIMALISTCDVKQIESDFNRISVSNLSAPAEYIVGVAAMLDFWLQRLASATTEPGLLLRNNIHDVIKTALLPELHQAAEMTYQQGDKFHAEIAGLSSVWAIAVEGEGCRFPYAKREPNRSDVASQLESALLKMTAAIRHLKTVVAEGLPSSMEGQSHEPAIGLFMVFLRLYETAQKRLNRFTSRHLAFYYRDCLKTSPRKREAESYYLEFEPSATATPFIIDQEAAFAAAKQPTSSSRHYYLNMPLLVRRATVSDLRTLYFQRNPLVSPECELGYVTRIKSDQRTLPFSSAAMSMPLFGGLKKGGRQSGTSDATVGLCIASSVLALKEGRREVELTIDFELPDEVSMNHIFRAATEIKSATEFKRWFGRVFSYYLLSGERFLNKDRKEQITHLIAAHGGDAVHTKLLSRSWHDLFYSLLCRPFLISLSGESGWLTIKEYLVSPAIEDDSGVNSGLKIKFSLGHNVESIVPCNAEAHGGGRAENLPVMNISPDSEASFFSYSFLSTLAVKRVELNVSVSGVRDLVLSNQLGRLDPAKPFAPFGPLPTRHSYLVIGSREAAGKQITKMSLALEWGGLPSQPGGFSRYYDGYDFVPHTSSFEANITVLQDGHWMPGHADMQPSVRLFKSGNDGVVSESNVLDVSAVDYFKPLEKSEIIERYEYSNSTRNSFVKLQVTAPKNGFGHADYPLLLTRILTENARLKSPRSAPNAPYTPTIRQLSLNYQARSLISLEGDAALGGGQGDDQIFHLHPFGVEKIYPVATKRKVRLFPKYEESGYLYVGIDTSTLVGELTLFFKLDEDAAGYFQSHQPAIHWRCLTEDGWVLLEKSRVLSDTTVGFLMSGVVTLNLPEGMTTKSLLMPQGKYWLQVSISDNQLGFSGLRSVQTNVALLSQRGAENSSDENIENNDWCSIRKIPGLAAVHRLSSPFGGRRAEGESEFQTRVSERLRHKGRASTVWDYERLILERFPEIYKVKCFPNTVYQVLKPRPGNILIVVVPHIQRDALGPCGKGVVNSAVLASIQKYVRKLSSSFVNVNVVNPAYERIQVRCSVKFSDDINAGGFYINRLNQAINDYLCPWCDVGYNARFGWTVRGDDIESFIRELSYVDFVTNFSMLHVVEEPNNKFVLDDSAKLSSRHEAIIKPYYPWSLAIPMNDHFIETTATVEPIRAKLTGVSELEIGSTFIIGGN